MARLKGKNTQEIRGQMPAPILDAWNRYYQALWHEGAIDNSSREMIRLLSAEINDCRH